MSTRLSRRHRTPEELDLKGCGTFRDIFDDAMKGGLRLNDNELDFLGEVVGTMPEEATSILFKDVLETFAERRLLLQTLQSIMSKYEHT